MPRTLTGIVRKLCATGTVNRLIATFTEMSTPNGPGRDAAAALGEVPLSRPAGPSATRPMPPRMKACAAEPPARRSIAHLDADAEIGRAAVGQRVGSRRAPAR